MNDRFITMGDPRGVGADLILLSSISVEDFNPVVVGSRRCLEERAEKLSLPMYKGEIVEPSDAPADFNNNPGACAFSYLEFALKQLLSLGHPGLLVTGPINKFAMREAGFKWPGHTEYLADRAGAETVHMLFANDKLRVILTTVHEAIADIPQLITKDRLTKTIKAGIKVLTDDYAIKTPAIAVAGLNPHAGEGGLFGREEIDVITPVIDSCRKEFESEGVSIDGPIPPDTLFYNALSGKYDLVVAQYHDQGLIAVKSTDFHSTVNITLGLPFVRTSPDHGTAFDIVGTGKINKGSFICAWETGNFLLRNRLKNG